MAYASITYTSASGTTFALTNSEGDPIPYLRQADITVTVNGTVLTQGTGYTFNAAGTAIVLASAVSGATVIISRSTSIADATVVYTAGSTLTAQDLNNADNQIRYGLQEFSDTYDALTTGTGDLQALGGFIGSSETWVSDNAHAATTGAIDGRVDSKIDTALTTDVVAGNAITITDNSPSSGQITVAVTNGAIETAELADGAVTTAKILDANVTTAKILDSNVTTAKLNDAAVTTAKLANDSVTSAKIADGTIVAGDLASNSVTTAKIVDANVTTDKLADSSVTAAKIADGVITSAKLSASTVVTAAEQSGSTPDDATFFTTSASDNRYDARYVNVTGDTMSGALAMGNNKITGLGTPTASTDASTKGYVDATVAAGTIADADYGDITVSGTGTVWTIDNGVITSAKIADGTIVDGDISASAEIAVSKLADGAARQLLQTDSAGTGVEWTDNVDVPGTLDVTSTATFDGIISSSAGAAATPSITFTGDTNTGIYSPGADQVAISTNGTGRLFIDSSGRLLVGTTSFSGNATQVLQGQSAGSAEHAVLWINRGSSASSGNALGTVRFADSSANQYAEINCYADATTGSGDYPGRLSFHTTADGASSPTERMRIASDGLTLIGKTASGIGTAGTEIGSGAIWTTRSANTAMRVNRLTDDGTLVEFLQASVAEGTISVSGTTVSYNGAHLSRWSQLPSGQDREEILRGSVLSNIDEMCEWGDEENEQLNRMKVSDVEGDKNVSGVFQAWDDDDDTYTNDFYCAMTGDFIIRIAEGVTVERGDLLMSAGDGTAKPQDDDIIRSKTIAKVTSTNVSCTYDDGSYCVPCVLMAC